MEFYGCYGLFLSLNNSLENRCVLLGSGNSSIEINNLDDYSMLWIETTLYNASSTHIVVGTIPVIVLNNNNTVSLFIANVNATNKFSAIFAFKRNGNTINITATTHDWQYNSTDYVTIYGIK